MTSLWIINVTLESEYLYLGNETFLDILLFVKKCLFWVLYKLSNFVRTYLLHPVYVFILFNTLFLHAIALQNTVTLSKFWTVFVWRIVAKFILKSARKFTTKYWFTNILKIYTIFFSSIFSSFYKVTKTNINYLIYKNS